MQHSIQSSSISPSLERFRAAFLPLFRRALGWGFLLLLLLAAPPAQAQFLKKLGKAVKEAAEETGIYKAQEKTSEAISKAVDKATDPETYKKDKNRQTGDDIYMTSGDGYAQPSEAQDAYSEDAPAAYASVPEAVYAKSDFVPGDDIIFEDNLENETLGEFPSQWDLYAGSAEVVSIGGKKAIELANDRDAIYPLMKNPQNFLGDVFTIEFDMLFDQTDNRAGKSVPNLSFWKADTKADNYNKTEAVIYFQKDGYSGEDNNFSYNWLSSNGSSSGKIELDDFNYNTWHHFAISFNKRAWKMYIDGVRVINVPNVSTPPGWFKIGLEQTVTNGKILTANWRIARGAVPLYDRLKSDGKIVTYAITFDVGQSTVKPESMTELNRIAELMNNSPDLKFRVEGHTDNTGDAASNLTLSEARSSAVVDKLLQLGVSPDRLQAAGKGQTSPIADNSTGEGRTKNRRVEFVKM